MVLLVVDQGMFADALASVLTDRGIGVAGIVSPGHKAVDLVERLRPDAAVVEITGRTGRGREMGRAIRKLLPTVRVIALIPPDDGGLARQVMALGFHGSLTRDVDSDSLIKAITGSGTHVARSRGRRAASWNDGHEEFLVSQLTPREIEVIRLIATAAGSEDIARRLSISVNTVRSHIQSIFTKLQVHSRLGAVAFAARNELLSQPMPTISLPEAEGTDEASERVSG